ncbi:uncharacterized protein lrif1 [Salminus brasiliensis]|uniref:uncharacterized protein lrif1 n=1 Tax=Salminus brasiliensis TaxID=930266 RepID=UPI003B832237
MENGTGVYYQAMPAVGPDGKNVMKLIPVQKVNGKFFQTHIPSARNDCQPQIYHQPAHFSPVSVPQNKLPTLLPTADGRFILKMPPESNTSLNPVKSHHQGTIIKNLLKTTTNQVCAPIVTPKLTQNALQLPLQNNSKAVAVINSPQQPVTAKSPVLPSGHYLQIPPNATVRTVPASALPQSIKSQICNSLNAPSNHAKGLPTVVYVSPVNSLKLGPSQQLAGLRESEHTQSLTQIPSIGSVKTVNVCSTSSPKADQGATTPMKWVVQEGPGSTAPYLIPVTSPNMTSDIVKAVKQIETVKLVNQGPTGELTSTHAVQEKISPGKDNALVMCNGKVYFVAKKSSEITKDVIPGAGSNPNIKNSVQPSSALSIVPEQNSIHVPVSKNPNEIIDLCDEDDESSPCTASSRLSSLGETASENDEDSNVIFVSYIPPKSETETSTNIAETAPQNNSGKDTDNPGCDAENMEKGCERDITHSPVIDLDVSRYKDNAAADKQVKREAVSEQAAEVCKEVTEKISVDLGIQCKQGNKADTEMPLDKPAWEEIQQQKSDSDLRKIFGITSDLRIGLERINQAKEPYPQPERRSINKRTLEGIRKLIQESQIEIRVKQLIHAQSTNLQVPVPREENGPEDAKRKRLEGGKQRTCFDSTSSSVINSSLQSKGTVKYDKQSVSVDACTDSKVLLYCQGPEEETPSTSSSSEVAKQTVEPLSSSSSSFQSLESQTARIPADSTACISVSRKTPARQSKGSGRVCTACPCGTKVGAIAAISACKPHGKPSMPAVIDSSNQASNLTETNRDCNTVEKVLKKSNSSPPKSSVSAKKFGDEKVHSNQLHIKPDNDLLQNFSSLTMQQDAVSQPGSSSEGAMNGSSSPIELYSSVMLDSEEIKRQERIQRLKDLLKAKEAALEKLRQSM